AVPRSFGSPERAAQTDRFACDKSGEMAAMNFFKFVKHPEHVLGVGHHVGCRNVAYGTHIARHLSDPATANLFLLTRTQIVRIANDASFCATERDIDHRTFPGHPHR